jgi:hypothetical protein
LVEEVIDGEDGQVDLSRCYFPFWNLAPTERSPVMMTTHVVALPQRTPLQPRNTEPVAGVAVSVTAVCAGKATEQIPPQSIPPGELVTVPCPEPAFETVSVNVSGGGAAVVNDQT